MSAAGAPTPRTAAEEAILHAVRALRYGAVEVTIHDGRVVQIETKEKLRFENANMPHRTTGGPDTNSATGVTGSPEPDR